MRRDGETWKRGNELSNAEIGSRFGEYFARYIRTIKIGRYDENDIKIIIFVQFCNAVFTIHNHTKISLWENKFFHRS